MWQAVKRIGVLVIFAGLAGCASIPSSDFEPRVTEESIEVGVTTRQQLIDVLGEPSWEDPASRTVYYEGRSTSETFCAIRPIMLGPLTPFVIPWCESVDEDWFVEVSFDGFDRVASIVPSTGGDAGRVSWKLRQTEAYKSAQSAVWRKETSSLVDKAERSDMGAAFKVYERLLRRQHWLEDGAGVFRSH